MRKLAGALATGVIVATTLGALAAAPAFAANSGMTTPAPVPTVKANTDNGASTAKATPATQPMKMKAHVAMKMSRERVEKIQTALANGGQTVSIDGVWGPKTTAAVKGFQKTHDLKVTGHLDHETLMALPKNT